MKELEFYATFKKMLKDFDEQEGGKTCENREAAYNYSVRGTLMSQPDFHAAIHNLQRDEEKDVTSLRRLASRLKVHDTPFVTEYKRACNLQDNTYIFVDQSLGCTGKHRDQEGPREQAPYGLHGSPRTNS